MKVTKILAAVAAAFSLSAPALADNWADADALFARREESRDVVAQARAKYLEILNGATSSADKIRAVTQLGRLAIWEGEMVLPRGPADAPNHPAWKARAKVFADCWGGDAGDAGAIGFVEKINPSVIGGPKHEAYYFFKGVCMAWWGEAVSNIRAVAQVGTLKSVVAKGLSADSGDVRFEGGAPYRLGAGIYSNPKAAAIDPDLYNVAKAEQLARAALAAPEYPGQGFQGDTFYENYRGLGDVLLEKGDKTAAKEAYENCKSVVGDAIEFGSVPAGREPEAKWVLGKCTASAAAIP